AIVDAGAGGCTASILEVGAERVVLLASAGDPLGGGEDLDKTLVRGVLKGLATRLGAFTPDAAVIETGRQVYGPPKRRHAVMARATAVIPFLPIGPGGVRMQEISVEAALFETVLKDTVARVEAAARRALGTAHVGVRDLAAVYATGGLANLPSVRAAVERVL